MRADAEQLARRAKIEAGYALNERWLLLSAGLYVLTGACWLPVVWIQIRILNIVSRGGDRADVQRLMTLWMGLGAVAFSGVLLLLFLMVSRVGF